MDQTGDCWIWLAHYDRYGYGRFWYQGQDVPAHRISYVITNGQIPADMHIDHTCHNRACVNPDHLRLATPKQNAENRFVESARGVSYREKSGKYMARVGHNRKMIYVGTFDTEEEAEEAAKQKRLEIFTHSDMEERDGQAIQINELAEAGTADPHEGNVSYFTD